MNKFSKWKCKLNKLSSIFFAELSAIYFALKSIIKMKNKTFTIYSDSKSSLQTIQIPNSKHEIVRQIQTLCFKLFCNNNNLLFCWVPGHCGIKGNELADKEAKTAANNPRICLKPITTSDMKIVIKNQVYSFWKTFWNSQTQNKLKNIGTQIGPKSFSNFPNRLEEIKFTRIRLGHAKITHSFILKNEDPTICTTCHVRISVLHILLICPRFHQERIKYFGNGVICIKSILNRKNTQNYNLIKFFFKEFILFDQI